MHRYGRVCGEIRTEPRATKTTRYSGAATVDIQYLAPGESFDTDQAQYAFSIWVGGKLVNRCAIGPAAYWPESYRASPEAYDESARGALSFTIFELNLDPEQPGMESGMDGNDLQAVLDYDTECNILVRRTP